MGFMLGSFDVGSSVVGLREGWPVDGAAVGDLSDTMVGYRDGFFVGATVGFTVVESFVVGSRNDI